ncbi:MAG: PAS domain-containing protein, partial [Cyanothece sp. SIO1E1]|nr:PAS domain-containing protein [Cyanothece sp. SIO1E1]
MQHQDSSSQIQALQDQIQELQLQLRILKQDNELLKQAQGIAGLGIWQYDIKADKVSWSEEVYRIYNLAQDQSPPKMEEILHYASEEERQFVENQIYKAIVTGKAYSIDCTINTTEGAIKYVHAT